MLVFILSVVYFILFFGRIREVFAFILNLQFLFDLIWFYYILFYCFWKESSFDIEPIYFKYYFILLCFNLLFNFEGFKKHLISYWTSYFIFLNFIVICFFFHYFLERIKLWYWISYLFLFFYLKKKIKKYLVLC